MMGRRLNGIYAAVSVVTQVVSGVSVQQEPY